MNLKFFITFVFVGFLLSGCVTHPIQDNYSASDAGPITGPFHYVDGIVPFDDMGNIQVVVEIPSGTTAKWEVNKTDGKLYWEIRDDKPRIVKYVGYPGNYGMIPQTLLPYEAGGDGDPLDVLVLGSPIERGKVVQVKLIGVLKLLDGGEQDDKLIAVMPGTAFYTVNSIAELDTQFVGVSTIIATWFENYKGPGKMEVLGFRNEDEAKKILNTAIKAYK